MQSGKSMKALYWGLISVCEEMATDWEPALRQMQDYIFKMIETYNLYSDRNGKNLAVYETSLEIIREYPLQEDIDASKAVDINEVIAEVRSRKSYMNKWGEYEDLDAEIEQIRLEKEMLNTDNYTKSLLDYAADDFDEDDELEIDDIEAGD